MEKEEKDILEEIRDCYNNGLLSALVGAGFSKNVSDSFLGWGELLHDMIGELYETDIKRNYDNYLHQSYGVITDPKSKETLKEEYISEICKNEDYLELVSKYIQKKGIRESLEIYIESRIPYVAFNEEGKITLKIGNKEKEQIFDTKFSAHKELLLLNKIQNIYTTNYENLIEFTINLLGLGIKDSPKIVLSGRDLSDNIRNRNIIKIHGNLRQEPRGKIYFDGDNKLQYIIAKEDYDTYKKKHEAFTSLMRIAMLQGKFMLLGFSGTDANYKGWVTWMSDVLEGEGDDVTKIYIIDVSGKETPLDLQLYYDNHHTKVINLINEERLSIIGFEKKDVIAILQLQKDKKLDNDTKRVILTKFFVFLGTGVPENENFINGDPSADPDKEKEGEVKSVDTQSVLTFKNAIPDSYDYKKLWQEALSRINDNIVINDIAARIKDSKPQNRFPKVIYNQDSIIDSIVRKSTINSVDAFLISLAIDECGLNPHYYSRLIKDYDELCKLPLWNLLKFKEETFNGKDSKLPGTDDEIIYENIQRNLFHLNFKKANGIIKRWKPDGYFIVLKAMRLASQDNQSDKAFKLLSDYIEKENNPSSKMYAMQIANYISNRYPWPYDTELLYQYGVDGIGDMLSFMIQQLRGKVEAPKSRGWIGSTMKFGGSHPEYEKSLRTLRFISDCGIYLNYGPTCFFDKANWYLVFKNLYEEFPYPCFFYSIQYRDKDLLTRVGQDFAYSRRLYSFNEDILVKSLNAIDDSNTPLCFHEGLLYITCPLYMAVDEEVWYHLFRFHVFNSFIKQINNYDINSSLIRNIEYALLAFRKPEHINSVFLDLLTHYRENPRLAYSLICYHLHLKFIKDHVPESITDVLEDLASSSPLTDIIDLLAFLKNETILPDSIKDDFISKLVSAQIESIPNTATALNLCLLVKDEQNALTIAKRLLLMHDIWHCGVMENGRGWTTPNYVRLNVVKNLISWTDEEFQCIKDNLVSNIEKYEKLHKSLHDTEFMRNVQIEYLTDVLQFIESLDGERRLSLENTYKKVCMFLKERHGDENFIEGMLSVQSADVDYAMKNVIKGIEVKGVKSYIDELNYILDYVLSGGNAVNRALSYVTVVINNHSKEMIENRMCSKLYMIISLYKERWESIKEFSPVWSFNHLHSIALFLQNNGYRDSESVNYWLNDPFVTKFIR